MKPTSKSKPPQGGGGNASNNQRQQNRNNKRAFPPTSGDAAATTAGTAPTRAKTGSPTAGKDSKDAGHPMNYAQVAAAIPQTYHSTHRDLATPRPFQDPEHRQVTGRYSAGDAEPNELLFLQFFAAGDPASQELLQEHRAVVVEEVSREFGIKLPSATKIDDVVTIVTRRQPAGQYNTWVTTGDIKIASAARSKPRPSTSPSVERPLRTGKEGASTPSTTTRTDALSAFPTALTDRAPRTRTFTGSGSAQTSSETSPSRNWTSFSSTPSPTCGIASTRPTPTPTSRSDPPATSSPSSTRPAKPRNSRMRRTLRSAPWTPYTFWNTAGPLNSVTPLPS